MRAPPSASSSRIRVPQAASRRAAAAGSAKGMGATRRPASSAISASSRRPPPPPPMSSGMPTPRAPVAIRWAQRSGSWPRGSAARTRAGSASLPKRAENVCRTNCWSSVSARFTRAIPSSRQFGSLTPSGCENMLLFYKSQDCALYAVPCMHGDVSSLEWGFRVARQHRVRSVFRPVGHTSRCGTTGCEGSTWRTSPGTPTSRWLCRSSAAPMTSMTDPLRRYGLPPELLRSPCVRARGLATAPRERSRSLRHRRRLPIDLCGGGLPECRVGRPAAGQRHRQGNSGRAALCERTGVGGDLARPGSYRRPQRPPLHLRPGGRAGPDGPPDRRPCAVDGRDVRRRAHDDPPRVRAGRPGPRAPPICSSRTHRSCAGSTSKASSPPAGRAPSRPRLRHHWCTRPSPRSLPPTPWRSSTPRVRRRPRSRSCTRTGRWSVMPRSWRSGGG